MPSLDEFNAKDQKLRKNWLISTIIYVIGLPTMIAIITAALFLIAFIIQPNFTELVLSLYIDLAKNIIVSLISFYLVYHFAYKKQGMIYLSCYLIFSSVIRALDIYIEAHRILADPSNILPPIYFMLNNLAFIWWVVSSWHLIKLNKRISNERTKKKNEEFSAPYEVPQAK